MAVYTRLQQNAHFDTILAEKFDTRHIGAGYIDDFTDPFSDDSTTPPDSPASHISHASSKLELDSNDPLTPLKTALVQCCRCPNSQTLLPSYPDCRTYEYHAMCDSCTHAFCRKCTVDTDNVIAFDTKDKAHILHDAARISYFWSCGTCGHLQDVPSERVRRTNGVASVDLKKLQCGPCSQKANNASLCVAAINQTTRDFLSSPAPMKQTNTLPTLEEDSPSISSTTSESPSPRRPLHKMASSLDVKRHWSFRTLKRWTSISSMKTV